MCKSICIYCIQYTYMNVYMNMDKHTNNEVTDGGSW